MSHRDSSSRLTRRRYLAGATVAGALGLAGCADSSSTDGGNGGGDTQTTLDPADAGSPVTPGDDDLLPAPSLGPEDAAVTVMVFEDYACPHCAEYSTEVFPDIKSDYIDTGDIHYEFRDFPIPVSQESQRGANAARAVQNTVGNGAFWAYSKSLFENQDSLGPDKYAELAGPVGADGETVRTAAVEREYQETVQADRQKGVEMDLQGTPGVYVNGSAVGPYDYDSVSSAIEDAL